MRMMRFGAGAAMTALSLAAFGYEAQFVGPKDTAAREWGVAANWIDTSTGETPALPPGLNKDTPDDVIFPELATPATRTVHTTKETDGNPPSDAATGCTLDATLPRNRTAEPFMDGDTLCLRIRPSGLMLIVK